QIETKFLKNATNGAEGDTIASASSNDTGYTFNNTDKSSEIWIEYIQNSIRSTFKIDYPVTQFRTRYLAADSSFVVEQHTDIGWIGVPLLPIATQTTTVSKVTWSLR